MGTKKQSEKEGEGKDGVEEVKNHGKEEKQRERNSNILVHTRNKRKEERGINLAVEEVEGRKKMERKYHVKGEEGKESLLLVNTCQYCVHDAFIVFVMLSNC